MIQVATNSKQPTRTGVLFIVLLIVLLAMPGIALAQDLDALAEGQAAFNAGDYELSFSLWSTLATQGNTTAQVFVGLSYDNGWGTPRSPQLARVWYRKAAKKDNPSAQYLLGLHFIQGTRTERREGLTWLRRAAANGDAAAQRFLKKGQQRGWFKDIPPENPPAAKKKATVQTVALAPSSPGE
ncbi:MAG TPA: sel1 repeat family protein [Gammaproteobacteria bacterium]|nr:sel1 repeat family protein [Gammaproteobacteria bacterium]